jgi:hypothetical protein
VVDLDPCSSYNERLYHVNDVPTVPATGGGHAGLQASAEGAVCSTLALLKIEPLESEIVGRSHS